MDYIKYTHRRQCLSAGQTGLATPKTDPHPKKVMRIVWWGVNRIIHWEILSHGCTITADLYCEKFGLGCRRTQGETGSNLLFA
jgi:hypothetical protein